MSTVVTLGPVGFKPTGAYNNTREYKKLDVVIYQGSSYIAKSDSIGQLPTNTTYWELLVQKGDTGNGITSIAKTGTSGLVDTYTITYTDETTSTFTVTNGEKGDPGEVTEEQLDEAMARANMVYNALPKVSDEGDSLTLDGTANCPMKMELKGNTEQTTYTGKNLFDITNYPFRININFDTDGSVLNWLNYVGITNYMPVQANTTYTQSNSMGVAFVRVVFYDENKTVISTLPNIRTFTTPNDCKYIRFSMFSEGNAIPTWEQIEQGLTATPYEPYTNGASPNPDYPQDVRVVTGNNSVKVEGKNLFDTTKYSSTANVTILDKNNGVLDLEGVSGYYEGVSQSFDVTPNQNYVLSYNAQIIDTSTASANYVRIKEKDDTTVIATNYNSGNQTISFTPTTDEINVFFRVNGETNRGHSKYSNIQLEKDSATPYEPYQSQTYPINLGSIELCKMRGYQDYIAQDIIFHAINGDSFYDTLDNATKQTLTYGKWYKHSEIGKIVLDGSENWAKSLKTTVHRYSVASIIQTFYNPNVVDLMSNYFTCITQNQSDSDNIGLSKLNGNGFMNNFDLSNTDFDTLEKYKTWLSTNTPIVYYILETPTNEEITDTTLISQLNAIENAVSYDTQTNIVQEYYSEPFIINVECVRSLKDIFELIQ